MGNTGSSERSMDVLPLLLGSERFSDCGTIGTLVRDGWVFGKDSTV